MLAQSHVTIDCQTADTAAFLSEADSIYSIDLQLGYRQSTLPAFLTRYHHLEELSVSSYGEVPLDIDCSALQLKTIYIDALFAQSITLHPGRYCVSIDLEADACGSLKLNGGNDSLRSFSMLGSRLKALPEGMGNFPSLEWIDMISSSGIRAIPSSWSKLKKLQGLDIQENGSLSDIAALSDSRSLVSLSLPSADIYRCLSRLTNVDSLFSLTIGGRLRDTLPLALLRFPLLEKLSLEGNGRLKNLDVLKKMPKLRSLEMFNVNWRRVEDDLMELPLTALGVSVKNELPWFLNKMKLESLSIRNRKAIVDFYPIMGMKFHSLEFRGPVDWKALTSALLLVDVRELTIRTPDTKTLDPDLFAPLKRLAVLDIEGITRWQCDALKKVLPDTEIRGVTGSYDPIY